jgi:hypothetical protein
MPMRELLEYMQFKVELNSKDNSVNLTMNGQNSQKNMEVTPDSSENQADAKAIEIIDKIGNLGYVETVRRILKYLIKELNQNKLKQIQKNKNLKVLETLPILESSSNAIVYALDEIGVSVELDNHLLWNSPIIKKNDRHEKV